jgi:hypothetical protein
LIGLNDTLLVHSTGFRTPLICNPTGPQPNPQPHKKKAPPKQNFQTQQTKTLVPFPMPRNPLVSLPRIIHPAPRCPIMTGLSLHVMRLHPNVALGLFVPHPVPSYPNESIFLLSGLLGDICRAVWLDFNVYLRFGCSAKSYGEHQGNKGGDYEFVHVSGLMGFCWLWSQYIQKV